MKSVQVFVHGDHLVEEDRRQRVLDLQVGAIFSQNIFEIGPQCLDRSFSRNRQHRNTTERKKLLKKLCQKIIGCANLIF